MASTRRLTVWTALVPVVALSAGLLFATSGQTAQGTDLRAGDDSQLSTLIDQREDAVARQQAELARVQQQIDELTDAAASRDGQVADVQAQADAGLTAAGLTPLTGTGVEVTLDDAPRQPGGGLPSGATGDDVVIHQSDVQGVVNALWAAGASGVAIMGRRLIATSAVRCVGNTLLLQGRTYSPPFVVTAIGDARQMRQQLAASPDVRLLADAAHRYGLTYDVADRTRVELPAYDGSPALQYASAVGR